MRRRLDLGDGAGARAQALELRGRRLDDRLVEPALERERALSGAEGLVLELFELRREIALDGLEGLAADVLDRDPVRARARDLDVVPVHPVEAHLEPGKAGAGAFARLELGDEPRRVVTDGPKAVELGVESGSDDPSLANRDRRRLDHGRLQVLAQAREVVDTGREIGSERAVEAFDSLANRRKRAKRGSELGKIARARTADCDPRENSLEVPDRAQEVRGARFRPGRDARADELLAAAHGVPVAERPAEPALEEPAAHRGRGPVEDPGERASDVAGHALGDLEVAPGDGIEHHGVLTALRAQPGDVRQGTAVHGPCILEGASRRPDAELQRLASETPEIGGAELVEQEPARALRVEQPRGTWGDAGILGQHPGRRPAAGPEVIVRDQDLGRRETGELGGEGVVPVALHDDEVSARHVEDGEPALPAMAGIDRREQTVATLFEQGVVGYRAGGQNPGDPALDRSPARGRVPDLIADSDGHALAQEPREITLSGVGGHPGHRDRPAVRPAAGGEGDVEQLVRTARVVEEQLVEVPHLVEEQLVRELRLDAEVLLHDRGVPPDLARRG